MNSILQITAIMERPDLLKEMVEKLAHRRYDIGFSDVQVPIEYKALETSTVESYANGTVSFDDAVQINMPFTTSFIFTCIKEKETGYELSWASSLS